MNNGWNWALDGTKISLYKDRVKAWNRGDRIAPVTIDIALTQACNYKCVYCYGTLQENKGGARITGVHLSSFINDCSDIGVKGIAFVGDGESTLNHHLPEAIGYARAKGIAVALGTNGFLLASIMHDILPCLSYLRVNISAGNPIRYSEIMGTPEANFDIVCNNIATAVAFKKSKNLKCTIGLQMVLMPQFIDQIMPLTRLALKLGVDYLQIKHCSDNELGTLGVDYDSYKGRHLQEVLRRSEACSNETTRIKVKWSKIKDRDKRSYRQCYGPPFMCQISGTGLVAPCGMLFNDRYSHYHLGNITKRSFKAIWESDHYWRIMRELASNKFDARSMCGTLCLQHSLNKWLDKYKKYPMIRPLLMTRPKHIIHKEFV